MGNFRVLDANSLGKITQVGPPYCCIRAMVWCTEKDEALSGLQNIAIQVLLIVGSYKGLYNIHQYFLNVDSFEMETHTLLMTLPPREWPTKTRGRDLACVVGCTCQN